jgi:hypothetical protein
MKVQCDFNKKLEKMIKFIHERKIIDIINKTMLEKISVLVYNNYK